MAPTLGNLVSPGPPKLLDDDDDQKVSRRTLTSLSSPGPPKILDTDLPIRKRTLTNLQSFGPPKLLKDTPVIEKRTIINNASPVVPPKEVKLHGNRRILPRTVKRTTTTTTTSHGTPVPAAGPIDTSHSYSPSRRSMEKRPMDPTQPHTLSSAPRAISELLTPMAPKMDIMTAGTTDNKRTLISNVSPKEEDMHSTLKTTPLHKRWGCSASSDYSSSACASHRMAILCIIIAVILLKIGLIVLLVCRHKKRKAARAAESKRVQDQILQQKEAHFAGGVDGGEKGNEAVDGSYVDPVTSSWAAPRRTWDPTPALEPSQLPRQPEVAHDPGVWASVGAAKK
ncbi:hypothetical protein K504DRAFT_502509 [Pleomassaria siparia CBS 279.74]|uniref:Uncharacterized protein n=1 Tax=Pleomassaria siparia CBS 279.74 TaxID=1314801 RepID=A0A6G1KAG1_9PLEO|nr:hypothetical protein K504DRAFT_502509 [Pleomassaria siparia CBS 279.74]